ncbi:hypothetical protein OAV88_03430 [bacterium]|nr:hypothetical protein [bacterium]
MKSRKCGKTFSLDSTDEEEYSSLDEEDDKEIVVEPPITPIDSLLDDIVATNLDDFDSAEDEERGEVKNTPLNDIESEGTLVEDVIFSSDEDEKKEEAPPKNKSIQDMKQKTLRSVSSFRRRRGAVKKDCSDSFYGQISEHVCTDMTKATILPSASATRRRQQKDKVKSKSTKAWSYFKSVVKSSHRRDQYKHRIKMEFQSKCFMDELMSHVIRTNSLKGKTVSDDHRGHAIFILGPSAAGKSYGLKSNLHRILHTAEWNKNESFHVIDGGIMRECSKMWGEMKSLRLGAKTACGSSGLDGFEDLYKSYFKPHITKCKKALFAKLKNERRNVLIPDTATSFLKDKTWNKIKKLHKAGYKILMCAVVASKAKCE